MVVLLLTVGALGVDIGNQVTRKSDTQNQADFAAWAAAGKMTATGTPGQTVSADVLQAVADQLNANQPQDDNTAKQACVQAQDCVQPSDLDDGDLTNGEVRYTTQGLQVVAPDHWVSFGMARIMGFDGSDVAASATVNLFSPGLPLPFYTTSTCLWGTQTLKDNSGGLSIPVTVPKLWPDAEPPSDTYNATLTSPLSPAQVALNTSSVTLTINGSGLSTATQVGFFKSDQSAPTTVSTTVAPATRTNTKITVVIPDSVTAVNDVWYVRVYNGTNWSSRANALSLQVGDAVLQCDPGSKSGNFGSLDVPGWSGSTNEILAQNIALGPKPPVSLVNYPAPVPTTICPLSDPRTVYSSSGESGMNCVGTDTGLRSVAATPGFLTGGSGYKGRLDKDTSSDCTAVGMPIRNVNSDYPSQGINDDLLSCFFTDLTTSVATISSPSYCSASTSCPVLSPDIYDSPRFGWVPVLDHDPNGKKTMPIVTFQPCFITDQPSGATKNNNLHDTTSDTDNGLVMKNGSLRAMRVIFFNAKALPPQANGDQVSDYFGAGPKIIRLVD
jgi:hypothetical protein